MKKAKKNGKAVCGRKLKQTGFTLLEMIVVVGIIAILAAVLFINLRGGGIVLQTKAEELASFIKEAQNKALAGTKHGNSFPQGGYGIYIEASGGNNYIVLFADDNGDNRYRGARERIERRDYGKFADKEKEPVKISEIKIKGINSSGGIVQIPTSDCPFIYLISDAAGKTTLKCEDNTNKIDEVIIVLEDKKGNTKDIIIKNTGSIEVR